MRCAINGDRDVDIRESAVDIFVGGVEENGNVREDV